MSSEHPFRNPSNSASVELSCPYCKRSLYVAPLEALVTLTTCPHFNCQRVVLICIREARGRDGSVALTFERFLETRARVDVTDVADGLFACGLFIVTPMTMWAYAWSVGPDLLMMVVMFTHPAALMGLGLIIIMVVAAFDARRECRRIAAVRRQAFPRARWEVARVRPQITSAA